MCSYYRDGFSIKGRIHEKSKVIFDSASGRAFPIFSGNFYMDDFVRNILFSRDQVGTLTRVKPTSPKKVERVRYYRQPLPILSWWEFDGFGEWNEKGERTATYRERVDRVMQHASPISRRKRFM